MKATPRERHLPFHRAFTLQTPSRRTAADLPEEMDATRIGVINAFTSKEHTVTTPRFSDENLPLAIDSLEPYIFFSIRGFDAGGDRAASAR